MPLQPRSSGKRKIVLIVDDSATVRAHLTTTLADEYDCITADNGQIGMEKALESNPDVMIIDLEMPVMDGRDLLRALKANNATREIPVVMATTSTAVDQVNECRALGCASFVLKPVQEDYLRVKLRQLIAARNR